jgi:hypothetical protein
MLWHAPRALLLVAVLILAALSADAASAQTEILFNPIGMDNQFVFPHVSLPGANGIDFSFTGAFAPMYPPEESHTVVIDFEWGPSATGPWSVSPDNVNTVPGGMTDLFATGIFHAPEDAAFVAIHFYAGGLMTVSGEFTHTSTVPEPSAASLLLLGLTTFGGAEGYRRFRRKNIARKAAKTTWIDCPLAA